ncbi:MAG: hypothetical protein A2079_04695 [Geobacteraceae bacterium GWC2_48_7]|nr:MAG: hypothetical protein A2079_04695 [Geobacteraceae bacterium GWC2_48_7]
MSLFLITFLTLYGILHAYLFLRLYQAFRLRGKILTLIFAFMLFMIAAPVLVRLLEHGGYEKFAVAIAWPTYLWMGALFILIVLLLLLDCFRFLTWIICRFRNFKFNNTKVLRLTTEVALLLTCVISIYAFFEARSIKTEHLVIQSPKIPAATGKIRIVQISDVHLGLLGEQERLKSILKLVNEAKPDILVSTGDLVDGRLGLTEHSADPNLLPKMLSEVKAPYGKFAVLGNHEVYAGIDHSIAFTNSSGFSLLRGEQKDILPFLSIAGVDDPAALRIAAATSIPPEDALLKKMEPAKFRILLKHRPVIAKQSDGLFDLQLSGHTHQGQIFPFNLLVRLQYPYTSGTISTPRKSTLHVSRGSGTWGPPLRFLAPPEVTIIDLVITP